MYHVLIASCLAFFLIMSRTSVSYSHACFYGKLAGSFYQTTLKCIIFLWQVDCFFFLSNYALVYHIFNGKLIGSFY